jgi:hypothetical protein
VIGDEQVAAAIADPVSGTVHPIINGRVMLPGATFVARNRISGKCHTFKYRGRMGHSLSGEATVEATDSKGNGRSVSVESIVTVRPQKKAS